LAIGSFSLNPDPARRGMQPVGLDNSAAQATARRDRFGMRLCCRSCRCPHDWLRRRFRLLGHARSIDRKAITFKLPQ
jgi:hypothetical protein